MKTTNKNFINILAFIALVIVALLMFVDKLLPVVGLNVEGVIFDILRTISNLFTVIILGVAAYHFASNSKKWVKIVYWVSVSVFIVATILIWIKYI